MRGGAQEELRQPQMSGGGGSRGVLTGAEWQRRMAAHGALAVPGSMRESTQAFRVCDYEPESKRHVYYVTLYDDLCACVWSERV